MSGQICSSCGYQLSFFEVILFSAFKLGSGCASNSVGIHTVSNALGMKCPSCGESGRWLKD